MAGQEDAYLVWVGDDPRVGVGLTVTESSLRIVLGVVGHEPVDLHWMHARALGSALHDAAEAAFRLQPHEDVGRWVRGDVFD